MLRPLTLQADLFLLALVGVAVNGTSCVLYASVAEFVQGGLAFVALLNESPPASADATEPAQVDVERVNYNAVESVTVNGLPGDDRFTLDGGATFAEVAEQRKTS